jgi:hypothetical protein
VQNDERNAELVAEVTSELGGKTPSQALVDKCQEIDKWNRTLTVQYEGFDMTLDVLDNVRYDPAQLSMAMTEQPMKVAWWGSLVARLSRMSAAAKVELERAKAEVAQGVRGGTIPTPLGKITEGAVAEVVALHPLVTQAQDQLFAVTEKLEIAKAVVEALRHRRDMIHLDGLLHNTELRSLNINTRAS